MKYYLIKIYITDGEHDYTDYVTVQSETDIMAELDAGKHDRKIVSLVNGSPLDTIEQTEDDQFKFEVAGEYRIYEVFKIEEIEEDVALSLSSYSISFIEQL